MGADARARIGASSPRLFPTNGAARLERPERPRWTSLEPHFAPRSSHGEHDNGREVTLQAAKIVYIARVDDASTAKRRRRHHYRIGEARAPNRAERLAGGTTQRGCHVLDAHHRDDLLANVRPTVPPLGVDDGGNDRQVT